MVLSDIPIQRKQPEVCSNIGNRSTPTGAEDMILAEPAQSVAHHISVHGSGVVAESTDLYMPGQEVAITYIQVDIHSTCGSLEIDVPIETQLLGTFIEHGCDPILILSFGGSDEQ